MNYVYSLPTPTTFFISPLTGQSPKQETKEHNMARFDDMYTQKVNSTGAVAAISVEAPKDEAKKYLLDRVSDIFWEKSTEINNRFSDPHPKTFKDAMKWLEVGSWRFDKYGEDDEDCDFDEWSFRHHFHWGKVAPDRKAQQAALNALD